MRATLHTMLGHLQNARRDAQADYDDHMSEKLGTPAPEGDRDEQLEQTLAALVRLLDSAVKDVRDAIATCDQLERLGPSANRRA
jgi:hypothetical protein